MEPGRLVQLKSGGPVMVVADVNRTGHRASVTCVWYNAVSGKAEKEVFFIDCIDGADRAGNRITLPQAVGR